MSARSDKWSLKTVISTLPASGDQVGHLQRHVLIIVEYGYADHFHHAPCSRGQPDSPTSSRTSLASWRPL
jgi:hypothetical protein